MKENIEKKILNLFQYNHKLKFSEIEDSLKIRSNKIAYHIKSLVKKKILIKEGETYTIIRFVRMELEKNKFGVLLKEVQLSSESFPYELYDAERFLPLDLLTNALHKEEESVLEADLELV
jgi:DNA-binding Lrp family transcriptional regulator